MTRTTTLLALLAVASTSWAATWSDYGAAFPAFPCNDGWMACIVDGQKVSPDLQQDSSNLPVPADLRVGWFDLKPTKTFSPFTSLSAYTGEEPGEAVAVAAEPVPPQPMIDPEAEAREARQQAEREAARQADAAAARLAEEQRAAEERSRQQGAEAERRRAQEMARIEAERQAALQSASSDDARAKAEAEARQRAEAVKRQQAEEERQRQEALKRQQEESQRRAAEEASRRQAEAETAAKQAEEEARKKAEEERQRQAAAAKAKSDAAAAVSDPQPGAAAAADGSCDDLVRLEPAAMLGKLNQGQVQCLEGALAAAARQTEKEKISLILMANAYSKGDKRAWERLVKRHLDEIDQSNPDLCYKYALHLSRKGPSRAYGVLQWSDVALENRTVWTGDTYTSRVFSLYKLKAAAAQQLWQQSEEQNATAPTEETKAKVEEHRNMTKVNAREWLEYARVAGKDTSKAMQLCTSAAGTADYCEGG